MTIVNFKQCTLTGRKDVKCRCCGKRLRRTKTFRQSISMFNLNASGEPKTSVEIHAELSKDVKAWEAKKEICGECKP